jgi:hypothetical protein
VLQPYNIKVRNKTITFLSCPFLMIYGSFSCIKCLKTEISSETEENMNIIAVDVVYSKNVQGNLKRIRVNKHVQK